MDPTPSTDDGAARASLDPLDFLLGCWLGEGDEDGAPLTSEAEGRRILGGTWLEVRESVRDAAGRPVHEDATLYRFDPEEGHLRVVHCLPGGWRREWPVLLREGRVLWVTGPAGPRVELEPSGGGWCTRVTLPGQTAPSVTLRYRRAGG